jgi:FkbM family methyltransferase
MGVRALNGSGAWGSKDMKDTLKRLRRRAGRIKRRMLRTSSPADKIADLFDGRSATLVNIGANDGVTGDPLYNLIRANPQWTVLFIEPIKALHERLKLNFPTGNYLFERVAIADQAGTKPFYYVSDEMKTTKPDVPWWYDQLGSFNREHILKHDVQYGTGYEPFIVSEDIPCDTLCAVLTKHRLISAVDIFHIDTEGYDYEILKQIEFSSKRLRAIFYENKHLTKFENAGAESILRRERFIIRQFADNTLAFR